MYKTIEIIAESLAFLSLPSRSFSRLATIGIGTIAPGRLSGNIRPRWIRSWSPIPRLRRCIAYCRDCGIRFLTHPRNAGRRNLRCPFGCRRHHRRQRSCQRSTAYYQTAEGKRKKKRLNARRQDKQVLPAPPPDLDRQAPPANEPRSDESSVTVELRLEGVLLDESSLASSPMLPYVRMVVGLIEGIKLTCREVLHLLRRSMRQRSFGARRKIDYLLGFLHQHPP